MKKLITTYVLIEAIGDYYINRCGNYKIALKHKLDSMTKIVNKKLLELEANSLTILRYEKKKINPHHSTYMSSGPTLAYNPNKKKVVVATHSLQLKKH